MRGRWLALLLTTALPVLSLARAEIKPLSVTAKSAIIIDADSGAVLWSKNPDARCYPASTTKIMTALVLLENRNPADIITAPDGIEKVPPSSMYLKSGEKITVHDLVYAMLLHSANDAAVAVAWNIAGSREAFANMMNQEAKSLGCTDTHFDNPNGLDDPNHWTTASDMAKIARRAMEIPFFREVVSTKRYTVERSINTKNLLMVNRNKMLWKDPTDNGIKTGWTVPAGHCFVGSCVRDGMHLITVEFDSKNWTADSAAMMNWGYDNFTKQTVRPAGTQVGTVSVGENENLTVGTGRDLLAVVPKGTDPAALKMTMQVNTKPSRSAAAGQQIGLVQAVDSEGEVVGQSPLVVLQGAKGESAEKEGGTFSVGTVVIGGALLLGAVMVSSKSKRRWSNRTLKF